MVEEIRNYIRYYYVAQILWDFDHHCISICVFNIRKSGMQILYADLIRAAAAPPSTDPYFLGFTIFAITAFCVEIALSCLVRRGYFLKYEFPYLRFECDLHDSSSCLTAGFIFGWTS